MASLTSNDIQASLERLQENFQGNYGDYPIKEEGRSIGSISSDRDKIYITFRGSVNSFKEILTCFDVRKESLTPFGLQGRVHKGIYAAVFKTHKAVLTRVKQLPTNREIILEGYSRGAGVATVMGAYLQNQLPDRKVSIRTFSSMKICDKKAKASFEEKVPSLYNFACEQDLLTRWWAPSFLGFVSVGKQYQFSGTTLPNYTKRVETRQYLHMMTGWVGSIVRCLLPARIWEAHMPETYLEGAPLVKL